MNHTGPRQNGLFAGLLASRSPSMLRIRGAIRAAAQTEFTVLLTGESGTGKELVARRIHRFSCRSEAPFVPVNCCALPSDLIESELFGHRKGAFTGAAGDRQGLFQAAHGGTLFLDEIGDMPLQAQVKLLRVLQQGTVRPVGGTTEIPVDARIVAATNQDVQRAIEQGRFRLDLFYRLNVLHLELPPVRERIEDLPALIACFQRRAAERLGLEALPRFSREVLALLSKHAWPGNLRELENVVEVASAVSSGPEIRVEHLPPYLREGGTALVPARTGIPSLRDMERQVVRDVLERVNHNKSKAARILGISRSRLYAILASAEPSA